MFSVPMLIPRAGIFWTRASLISSLLSMTSLPLMRNTLFLKMQISNLGFFSNSKNAEILTAEFRKKIEAAKKEVVDLEYKIKMMNNPKAAEEAEAPAAEAEPAAETEKPAEA